MAVNLQALEISVQVGKNGVTENVIEQVKRKLKVDRVVKIKITGSSKPERYEISKELAEKTGSKIARQIGFVIILKK